LENFGRKTTEEAYRIFIQNPFGYVEDFRWIAPAAFTYYFPIVARHLTSPDAKSDSDTVSSLAGILESLLGLHNRELASVFEVIAKLCSHIINHYSEYDLDYNIHGDVKSRYEHIAKIVSPSASA